MKKNSQRKPSFKFIFFLISILIIGILFGTEVMKMIIIDIAFVAAAMVIVGTIVVLGYSIIESRK